MTSPTDDRDSRGTVHPQPGATLPRATVEGSMAAAAHEPGPSRREQLARMPAAQLRRGVAAKLRTLGASRSEVRQALRPRACGARHRRAPGARPVRRCGSRRSSRATRGSPEDPDPDESDSNRLSPLLAGGAGRSNAAGVQLRLDRPEVEMLARKPAWERAVVYDAVNLSLPEREQVEVAVRARIAAEVGPR